MSLMVVLWLLSVLWILPGVWALACCARDRRRKRGFDDLSSVERALAEERSSALLHDLLDEREYQQLMQHGYMDVASPSRTQRVYRIPRHTGRVRIYEDGRALAELCVQPVVSLPANDVIVLHKVMITADEQGYLAQANEIPLPLPPQFYDHQRWNFLML